ncbi:MerR family transcriptional regulator [Paenibacillus cremeus]|uniref:MerR family transcriptional regulator n=1 Tax=Paenibacillus cremeus TaxID=2163881 RepID=A0A559KD45_9BACL|nr:MerR family transcriptional regulator [Paenibacillus cremeus]TVY10051.1 MerR family transcriptional regulator [Paenibacillus cremeus]
MSEDQILDRAYSITEFSELLEIPPGTLRQWEKDFNLKIPRNAKNVRYYTQGESEVFRKIKSLREKGSSVEFISQLLREDEIAETAPEQAPAAQASAPESAAIQTVPVLNDGNHALLLNIQERLTALPEVIKAAFSEQIKKEVEAGNKLLLSGLTDAVCSQVIDVLRRELTGASLQQAQIAAVSKPERKKKSIWRKDIRKPRP